MTIPNILSTFRLILVPVFVIVFFNGGEHSWIIAGCIFALAGITDCIDGRIARKFNQITMLGRILDPLADKLMVLAALVSTTIAGIVPLWVTVIFTLKEVSQGICSLLLYRKIKDVPPSNILGKAGTFLFYVVLAIIIVFNIPSTLKTILLGVSLALIASAFLSYILRGIRLKTAVTVEKEK